MSRFCLCLLLLSGCSHHAIRCDAHLQPINAGTVAVKQVAR